MEELLKDLNREQREAVLHFDSPLLILAGAGSGKTRVITYKIAYMVKALSFEPQRILAITFTNKAAREMKERVSNLLGLDTPIWVSTFHSFCVKLLRREAETVGLSRNFLILDTDDKKRILKEIIKDLNLDLELYTPAAISSIISNVKNGTQSLEEIEIDKIKEIFKAYEKKLRETDSLDFDDLLLLGRDLLKKENLREKYSKFFRYVLVDEYQDTNKIQYEIVKALTKEKGNICVVGDEDQCIYTWRGANIENILSFEKDFKNAKVIKLEKNYRCTKTILLAANSVIKNNKLRKGKTLYTDNPQGEPIRLFAAESDTQESLFVAKTIKQFLKKNVKPHEIAVIYRTNSQSRIIEDALRRENIPYQIVGGIKFYERKEVKDILAYLRVAIFESDEISLLRILNTPRRGLGEKVEKVLKELLEEEKSSIKALEKLLSFVKTEKQKNSVELLINIIKEIRERIEKNFSPFDVINFILKETGYEEFLRKENPTDFETRLENVKEVGNTISEFAEREKLKGKELYIEFFNTIALSSDQDEMEESERVVLMTVHASKGLEFPIVFIVGLEEGLFPHIKSLDSFEEMEEERRLFYVAITRAKKILSLSYAKSRRSFGKVKPTKKSRFLDEIPKSLIKEVKKKEKKQSEGIASAEIKTSIKHRKNPKTVFHKKFGKGKVLRVSETGDNAKVTVFFPTFGEKTIIMKFLEVLEWENNI
ncbi:MAG: UvrD-helicase domain-containing protein [Desulfurobacteriaceae bacterium]